jgi:hypothetical protein
MQPETILWQGKPVYRRWGLPLMLFVIADIVTLGYFSPISIAPGARSGLALIVGLLTLLWLRTFFLNAGVSYYITDRRVMRRQELPILKKTTEKPLNSITSIRTIRRFGRGFVIFLTNDASNLMFINLKQDPEPIREIAEKARYAIQGKDEPI